MFKSKSIDQLQSALSSQGLDIHHLIKRVEQLESKLGSHIDKTKESFRSVKKDYDQLSKWDDQRRDEIFALADAADLEIRRGVHLVAKEDEE